ncbi:MAG: hypothetical protein GWQ08_03865 [Verrucomicrobiaceae bacterium]|nr:hypothetical protein [Verrucomicrobiaceae bacterium]
MVSELQTAGNEKSEPQRRWRRRLCWLGLGGIGIALWLSGPGFRWLGGRLLPRVGMEQGCVLEGNLWSGPVLKDFVWKDEATATEVRGREVRVAYSPVNFFRGGVTGIVESITLADVTAVIDQRGDTEKEPDEGGMKPLPFKKLPQPRLVLENVDVTVLQPEDKEIRLQDFDVSLGQSSDGNLSWASLALPNGTNLDSITGSLSYSGKSLRLANLPLIDELAISDLEVSVSPERMLDLHAVVAVPGSFIVADVTLGKRASLRMSEGTLDLAKLLPNVLLRGEVTRTDVSIAQMQAHWSQWQVDGNATMVGVEYQGITVDKVDVTLSQTDFGSNVGVAVQLDSANKVSLSAAAAAVEPRDDLASAPWTLSVVPQAPSLAKWMRGSKLPAEVASLMGEIRVKGAGMDLRNVDGEVKLGQTLVAAWEIPSLVARLQTEDKGHLLSLAGDDQWIDGVVRLSTDFDAYLGKLSVKSDRLAALQPNASEAEQIGGAAAVVWEGEGVISVAASHRGTLQIDGTNIGSPASGFPYEADIMASYEGDAVQLNRIEVKTAGLEFEAQAALSKASLAVSDIQLSRSGETWLQGRIQLPLSEDEGSMIERFWGAEESARIELQSVSIPVQSLAQLAGQKSTFQGTIEIQADISGPPASMQGSLDLKGRGLGLPDSEGSFPSKGDVDFELVLGDGGLDLKGEVRHELIEPIALVANVPLQIDEPAMIADSPVTGSLKLPPTNLAFVKDYAPALREIVGNLSADMQISGTAQKPIVAGTLVLSADRVSFVSDGLPRLENTKISLRGTPSAVVIEEVRTGFAGGLLELGGGVKLDGEQGPTLDLLLTAKQALLTRNENMVVRSNGEIRFTGPWAAASVSGDLRLVESRYFQEIDLLPTNKQGTTLPSSPMNVEKTYGTEAEPFKDWQLDLKILTEDSFRVRTNLAAADIVVDLRLSGPLSQVYPEGFVDLKDTYAQLPFSRLDLNNSYVRFSEETGFPGQLDIRGESQIRDYLTRIVVSGNANKFDYVLTSNPPLPDEEIMALLGTGATREDLVGSGQAAASRAAILLFDKLWRKIAKKDWEDPGSMREKRLTFESGNVNARTGSPMTTARLRLTDNWSLTSDASLGGDFRGLLHYLFKF